MTGRIKAVVVYCYDFVVGDDWRVAVGVALALLATWAISTTTVAAWWVMPVSVTILLPFSLWRAVKQLR